MNEEKDFGLTLTRRTKEQDTGSTYKTVMSKGQAMNKEQNPGSTHSSE